MSQEQWGSKEMWGVSPVQPKLNHVTRVGYKGVTGRQVRGMAWGREEE